MEELHQPNGSRHSGERRPKLNILEKKILFGYGRKLTVKLSLCTHGDLSASCCVDAFPWLGQEGWSEEMETWMVQDGTARKPGQRSPSTRTTTVNV